MRYPEHEKLKEAKQQSQMLHEFIDRFLADQGISLAQFISKSSDRLIHIRKSTTQIVADFLEIDLVKLEKEKEAMLKDWDEQRAASEAKTTSSC